jgi:hypothetical protein
VTAHKVPSIALRVEGRNRDQVEHEAEREVRGDRQEDVADAAVHRVAEQPPAGVEEPGGLGRQIEDYR